MSLDLADYALTELEAALAQRREAWDNERQGWDRLMSTINARDLETEIEVVSGLLDRIGADRKAIETAANEIETALGKFGESVIGVARLLEAIKHDPKLSHWSSDADSLTSNADLISPHFVQNADSLVRGIGGAAVDQASAAGTKVANAANRLVSVLPVHGDLVAKAADDLRQGVSDAFSDLGRLLEADDVTVQTGAHQLTSSVLQYQLQHANGLVQDVLEFRAGLEQAVGIVTALGQNLERLRHSLDAAIDASNSPIHDIRFILAELLDRFQSI